MNYEDLKDDAYFHDTPVLPDSEAGCSWRIPLIPPRAQQPLKKQQKAKTIHNVNG